MPKASPSPIVERILDRLADAERHESNPHFRDDYRIAWITVLKASRDELSPYFWATYAVLKTSPEMVWPMIEAGRAVKLGNLYEEFFGAASSPKKPVQSERDLRWKRRVA